MCGSGHSKPKRTRRLCLAVAGGGRCDEPTRQAALEIGRLIARSGAVLLCGGGTGVMEAAAEGARMEGGLTVGVLPGAGAALTPPNPFIDLPLYTGIGQARNLVLVLSADALIAVGGEWGTLSEIALAMKHGRPTVLLRSWGTDPPPDTDPHLPIAVNTPAEAVEAALSLVDRGAGRPS